MFYFLSMPAMSAHVIPCHIEFHIDINKRMMHYEKQAIIGSFNTTWALPFISVLTSDHSLQFAVKRIASICEILPKRAIYQK